MTPNLFLTIPNPDTPSFWIPTVLENYNMTLKINCKFSLVKSVYLIDPTGDDQAKPVLPSKTHRSLPKVPDPSSKPVLKDPNSKPALKTRPESPSSKPEKPILPKKGFSVSMEGRELLRSAPGRSFGKSEGIIIPDIRGSGIWIPTCPQCNVVTLVSS